jgi:hypothetical protein
VAEPFAICYLNGEYLPLRDARISPLDRGFLFGDSVYEVLPVFDGEPFLFQAHLIGLLEAWVSCESSSRIRTQSGKPYFIG